MKIRFSANHSIRFVIALLTILAFSFSTVNAAFQKNDSYSADSNAAIQKYQIAQKDSTLSDEEKVKSAIETYFTLGYESQKKLSQQDFSFLIDDNNQNWVKLEKDKLELLIYISTVFQTPITNYKFNIDYDKIEVNGENARVSLRESNEITTLPDLVTSRLGNLAHLITLHYVNDGWKINQDEYQD